MASVPLHAMLDGNPVLSEDFSGAGELEYRAHDGAWVAALGTIAEAGGVGNGKGYYDYTPDPSEEVSPWWQVKISGVCDEYVWKEDALSSTTIATAVVAAIFAYVIEMAPGPYTVTFERAVRGILRYATARAVNFKSAAIAIRDLLDTKDSVTAVIGTDRTTTIVDLD